MEKKGLKPADLARGTGIKARTIGDWRRLGTNPSADKISCICDFLDVSLEYLLTGKEINSPSLRDDELDLLRHYNALPALEQGKFLARLEDKAKEFNNLQEHIG